MRKIILSIAALVMLAPAVTACGPRKPDRRAEYQADCSNRNGTYQDEGGPDWSPSDAECLAPSANNTIAEIEYPDD